MGLERLAAKAKKLTGKLPEDKNEYWLVRFALLRVLAIVYLFAFLSLATQVTGLLGADGLTPADDYLDRLETQYDDRLDAFISHPTIFWLNSTDAALTTLAWMGVALSLVLLAGFANSPLLLLLWFLYLSFVHVGQLWYGYGWEFQLLETGFLAAFLVPFTSAKPFPNRPVPTPIIWLFRWLSFRIHLGTGLIKLRADECWQKLTCLDSHFETQPLPNPLSPLFHALPSFIHKVGTFLTHVVQIGGAIFSFWPRIARIIAGAALLGFQIVLILSGNLSFLNWVTIVPILALFDDASLKRFFPQKLKDMAQAAKKQASTNAVHTALSWVLVVVVAIGSIPVVANLVSDEQAMNLSYGKLHLVNTYGAFGSITKERYELVFEGSNTLGENASWRAYEFVAKPTNTSRPHPVIAPYQPRLDWQVWFAAMGPPQRAPWTLHLVYDLLKDDAETLSLLESSPYDEPPRYIRVSRYKYEMNAPFSKERWNRTYAGEWLPPLSLQHPQLQRLARANGW